MRANIDSPPLTVRSALQLPCFQSARLVAGERGLDRVIRRAHVVDVPDAQFAWGKDALLLTSGYGLCDSPQRQNELVARLVERGLVGMVFSVGWYFDAVPAVICASADAADFPVIETPRELQFVSITERLYAEILKAQVLSQVEHAARGDLFAELVGEAGTLPASVRERAYAFGFRLEQPHQVFFLVGANLPDAHKLSACIESWMRARGSAALVVARETGTVVVIESKTESAGKHAAQELLSTLGTEYPALRVGAGTISPPHQSLKRSYDEAVEAASIGEHLSLSERVLAFSELGLWGWLYRLAPEDLRANSYWHKICQLAEHDARTRAELLSTLERYLEHGGALGDAADELNVHRNTLLYRLGRIEALLDIDLKNVDHRLNLHLALKAYRLKQDPRPFSPYLPIPWRAE